MTSDPERQRMAEADRGAVPWRRWGPYLALREWGTVREDYSADGSAWTYFTYEDAEARAYRWGEDGIAGLCDDGQRLCLALALWNGRDPVLKERLFGLTGKEGNHGEDVKEVYHLLDATPTHAYARMLYRLPQAEFPYAELRAGAARRGRDQPEEELEDTGVLDGGCFFDVSVEHAKAGPEDLLFRVEAVNHAPQAAELHLVPTLWFRNSWAWTHDAPRPSLALEDGAVRARHPTLGEMVLHVEGDPLTVHPERREVESRGRAAEWLFCDNDTNVPRLYGVPRAGFFKDGLSARIARGDRAAVNPDGRGTKAGAWLSFVVPPGGAVVVRARLARTRLARPFEDLDATVAARRAEADLFWSALAPPGAGEEARRVERQALAGMLWTRPFYHWDVARWLAGDPAQPPPPPERRSGRNAAWFHHNCQEILSVPDGWEYPWFAAWDLAFHAVALARVDPAFAKAQLIILAREWYMHPNGQLPAYEWQLADVNPPVHAWAVWRVYRIDAEQTGRPDRAFLARLFMKLLLNFTWWVNREDEEGNNVFEGGFLGLDNIGAFNRSEPLPAGGVLEQADGTAWMAAYCLDMLRIALELAREEPFYEDVATKFFEHFLYIAGALNDLGGEGVGLWDDQDQFFYDAVRVPGSCPIPLRARSLVGLIPLLAVEVLEPETLARTPEFGGRMAWFLQHRHDLAHQVSRFMEKGGGERRLLSLVRAHRMKAVLRRMLDEDEFLSPYGIRSLSRAHAREPYQLDLGGRTFTVRYEPGESSSGLFGGNSNWRGPVWVQMNYLLVEALRKFDRFYGPGFRVECPTRSGRLLSLGQVADEIARRVCRLFLPGEGEQRPFRGGRAPLAPGDGERLLFHEYFHGEDGRGLGAAHQTGWTALVAELLRQVPVR